MKEMNSETHSCTHSFASLDTLAVVGSEFFMMRETFAICRQSTIPTEMPLRIQGKSSRRAKESKTRKVKEVTGERGSWLRQLGLSSRGHPRFGNDDGASKRPF